MTNENLFDIVFVGLGKTLTADAEAWLPGLKIHKVETGDDFMIFLETYRLAEGSTVLVSSHANDISHLEVAQALNSSFPDIQVVFITDERQHFTISTLKKNGFAQNFLLPSDAGTFKDLLDDILLHRRGGGIRRYKAVKLVDLEAGQQLPFPVHTYMPLNRRYSLLTPLGELSEKKLQILNKKMATCVYVEHDKMETFYSFTANRLATLNTKSGDAVSETKRAEKLRGTVRDLFVEILDQDDKATNFDNGRQLLEQSRGIIDAYVKKSVGIDLKRQLAELMDDSGDYYSHARTVSTVAALLSMGTGIGKPEDMSIAGLFHDIGVLGTTKEVTPFHKADLSADETKKYQQHPMISVNLLREKKVTVTPEIARIIECHHERVDKKGFPNQLPEHKIPVESHILAYADAFEYLSRRQEGVAPLSFQEIHDRIQAELGLMPDLLKKIEGLLSGLQKAS